MAHPRCVGQTRPHQRLRVNPDRRRASGSGNARRQSYVLISLLMKAEHTVHDVYSPIVSPELFRLSFRKDQSAYEDPCNEAVAKCPLADHGSGNMS